MNTGSCELVSALVLRKLGLHVSAEVAAGEMNIWPAGYDRAESFAVRFTPGWRSADARLVPGNFAGATVRAMGEAGPAAKILFAAYTLVLNKEGAVLTMNINGSVADAMRPDSWPNIWSSFDISVRKTAVVFDLNKDAELLPVADLLVTPLVGMAMALIGTENIGAFEGEIEGKAVQYLATRYERKKVNRDACIRIHGTRCAGCGFSFGEFYGEMADGYIEVHHRESLAATGEGIPNPATDLVPLCSNCHSAVHRVTPPLAIDELKALVARSRTCSAV
jgi:5-methylcytosine-specific restriction protein A